jgi:hypothetical protein
VFRNPDAIAWYVEQAQRMLEDQQRRSESLRLRAGQVAAFSGAILALIGSGAKDMLEVLDGCSLTVAAVAILAAAVALAAAVVIAVIKGLGPKSWSTIDAEEIGYYRTDRFLDEPDLWRVHIRTLNALHEAVDTAQENGNEAVEGLSRALWCFVAGLLATVVAIATLVLHYL